MAAALPRSASSLRSPAKRAPSPTKKLPNGFSATEIASIRANYALETRLRRSEMEAQMRELLTGLQARFEQELARLPDCLHGMPVTHFLTTFKGDLVQAAEQSLRTQFQQEQQHSQQQTDADAAQRSPKKRKRNIGDSHLSVPPSPALPQAKRHAPNGFFSAAAAVGGPSTSSATPLLRASASVDSMASSTNGRLARKPRRNEAIQAYSMNGSPLQVQDAASGSASQTSFQVPSTDFTFRMALDSFAQGLKRELAGVAMRPSEKQDLEQRLLGLVQELQPKDSSDPPH